MLLIETMRSSIRSHCLLALLHSVSLSLSISISLFLSAALLLFSVAAHQNETERNETKQNRTEQNEINCLGAPAQLLVLGQVYLPARKAQSERLRASLSGSKPTSAFIVSFVVGASVSSLGRHMLEQSLANIRSLALVHSLAQSDWSLARSLAGQRRKFKRTTARSH